jgi:vanillate O-demethylase monooxygenase subunit
MYPLADGCFAPYNQWYVAGWSKDFGRDPMERWILDEPVAFYRTESGNVVALDGRCPHRHFPLGKSRVEGDNMVCGYHGIAFAPDGSCAEIPSQVHIPNVCKVKSYPVVETWNWVWIWPGNPALADESLIPDHYALGLTDPAYRAHGDWYHLIPGRYMLMHDNLFDLTHLPHLHRNSLGALAETKPSCVEQGPGWISSSFDYLDTDPPEYARRNYGYEGKVDRRASVKLLFPGIHVADEEYRKAMPEGQLGELIGGTRHFHAITPATRTTCHYYFAGASLATAADPEWHVKSTVAVYPTLAEDISATDYIEAMIQKKGGDLPPEILLRADATCVRGRRMFEDAIRAEKSGRRYPEIATDARPETVAAAG